jgi:uncharacterized protein with HEPN domain
VLFLSEKLDMDEINAIDMNAKKVLEVLAGFNQSEFANGKEIQEKTGFTPEVINEAVRVLEKSLLVNNPAISNKQSPYDFYAVEITDFGRQVLEKYG